MKRISIPFKTENIYLSAAKNRKIIEDHLKEASVYDLKSTKHLKNGHYEEAAYCAILSQEHLRIASEAKKDDILLHALYN